MTNLKTIMSIAASGMLIFACATTPPAPDKAAESPLSESAVQGANVGEASTKAPTPSDAVEPAPADTIESLSKDVNALERRLVGYIAPLTPKQEDEVDEIKRQIQAKESKKASLELKKMLGELNE